MTSIWEDLETRTDGSNQNTFSLKEVGKIFLCSWLLYSKNYQLKYISRDDFLQLREQCVTANMPGTLEILFEEIWYEMTISHLARIGLVSRIDSDSNNLYVHISKLTASLLLDACEDFSPEETKWMTDQIKQLFA